jgi:hypothetical protein
MGALANLNTYSSGNIAFTVNTQTIDRTIGQNFDSPLISWEIARTLGNLTGNGLQSSYLVTSSNTSIQFNNTGNSDNPLTVTNPSANLYVIRGILNIIDWNASQATVVVSPGYTGNVTYTTTYTNTNSAAGNFIVDYVGVP